MPLPPNAPPLPPEPSPEYGNWWPYENCVQFETSNILFTHDQLPAKKIDNLLNIWAASLAPQHDAPLFKNHDNLYSTIDAMPMPGGDANWKSFNLCFCPDKELPHNAANWNKTKWEYGIETPANSSTTCFKIQISATNLTTCLTKSMTLMVNITFIM